MTELEEIEYQKNRDEAYLNKANTVWGKNVMNFGNGYRELQDLGLYNGTSFQKKYYPKQYAAHLESLKIKNEN